MGKCPKCGKTISSLKLTETCEYDYDITFDPDSEELNSEPDEEWHGNDLAHILKREYSCPECKEIIFTDEQAAKNFLSQDDIEEVGRP